ncbi:hypothetical protein [Legionella resiliens]|uniref:Uncharacterized protein n=1 Tax=Legionella resiliens TaxID=2905958 RepID=A0ABS8X3S9_9GAMM|nr:MULTISPECIES: hypothetical protein [unclassified Legionella]MCE0722804.1 hypothetical protein [Legionella sp. 9fVS26]MCE3531957.1 hypothetical protein [Legionella sp. 8cVS16]
MRTIKNAKKEILKEIESYCIEHHLSLYAEITGKSSTYFINLFEKKYDRSFFRSSPIKSIAIDKNELKQLNHEKIHKIVLKIFEDHEEEEFHQGVGIKK